MFSFSTLAFAVTLSLGALSAASPLIAPEGIAVRGNDVIPRTGPAPAIIAASVGAEVKVFKRTDTHTPPPPPPPSCPQTCKGLRDQVNPLLAKIDIMLDAKVTISGRALASVFFEVNECIKAATTSIQALQGLSLDVILKDGDHIADRKELAQIIAQVVVDVKVRSDRALKSKCTDLAAVTIIVASVHGSITTFLCGVGGLINGLLQLIAPLLGSAKCFLDSLRILGLIFVGF